MASRGAVRVGTVVVGNDKTKTEPRSRLTTRPPKQADLLESSEQLRLYILQYCMVTPLHPTILHGRVNAKRSESFPGEDKYEHG